MEKEIEQKQAEIRRQQKFAREQDEMIHKNLQNQNARLEMLVRNYKLNRQWNMIQWRFRWIERIKRLNPLRLIKRKAPNGQ